MKRSRKISRIFILLAVILVATHILASIAWAHPLGNFTNNQYAGLQLSPERVDLDFVLDLAEIPAFQEITNFDANKNGQLDPSEAAGYHAAKCQTLQPDLVLRLDGRLLPWTLNASAVEFPPGAGGLPTLRLSCNFQAPLPALAEGTQFQFNNNLYPERLGWREITVTGAGLSLPAELASLNHSPSQRLTVYPQDLLSNPLDQRQLSFNLLLAGTSLPRPLQAGVGSEAVQPGSPPLANRNDGFTELIMRENLTWPAFLLTLVIACTWGAAHALTPGHGKTIVAAYLVGSRGTARHALFLGLTTTITHTAGVFILGFLTLFASKFILPEQLYPWLGVASGFLVVGIGLSLFWRRLPGLTGHNHDYSHHHGHDHQHDHDHPHQHDHHDHDHPHQHDHDHPHHHHDDPHLSDHGHAHSHDHHHHHGFAGHSHSHLPPGADNSPVTWRSLLALGISGGLIPCPSALIVMLAAIALQRIGFGLALILAFSLGLAGVLTAIGLLWVQAGQWFEYLPGRWLKPLAGRREASLWGGRLLQLLPAASAAFIIIVGAGITFQALTQTGLLG